MTWGIRKNKAVEVFLAEGRQKQVGEELDLLRWDEIKEEERKEESQTEREDRGVQTAKTEEVRDRFTKLLKDFPS